MRSQIDWFRYAMKHALVARDFSEDPYVKVGSCALRDDHTIAACGYNGPPPGVEIDWSDRDERRNRVMHAEANCLRYCKPGEIKILAVTLMPCHVCAATIAAYKVPTVVVIQSDNVRSDSGAKYLHEYKVNIRLLKID